MDVSETMRFLRAAGKRITPERRLLLRIIGGSAHLDACVIYRLARKGDPKINLSTVYRTVSLLEELELVEAGGFGEDHHHYKVRSKEAVRTIDLRGVPLLAHPKRVSSEIERLKADEMLEIITDDQDRLEMAPRMLGQIEGVKLLKIWREGELCHALVRRG